jgi:hypothetical protein
MGYLPPYLIATDLLLVDSLEGCNRKGFGSDELERAVLVCLIHFKSTDALLVKCRQS